MSDSLELMVESEAELGEGPSWDDRSNLLYWVDIQGGDVHVYQPDNGADTVIHVGGYVSSVVPNKSGSVVITLQHGFYSLDFKTKTIACLSEVEKDIASNRFNDGKCDARGRFWAGTMNMKESEPTGFLYVLANDYSVRKVLSGITISNGLGWSPDNKIMYYIDTPTRKVTAFDFDLGTGKINNQRTAVDFTSQEGSPDGMAVDREGMIWVAHWAGSKVSRWNPSNGKLLNQIILPARNVSSCCFGGKNLDELYITTARTGMDQKALSQWPYSGDLFRAKVDVGGLPTCSFVG
jgi:sugar lactone lactonase YvrE